MLTPARCPPATGRGFTAGAAGHALGEGAPPGLHRQALQTETHTRVSRWAQQGSGSSEEEKREGTNEAGREGECYATTHNYHLDARWSTRHRGADPGRVRGGPPDRGPRPGPSGAREKPLRPGPAPASPLFPLTVPPLRAR